MHTSVIRSRVGRASCTKRNIFTSSRRNFIFAHRNLAPTPWFVDEGTESSTVLGQSDGVNRKNDGQTAAVVQHSPPPSNTPDRLRALHAHLITLPLLDSVSVVPASRRLPAEASLPTQRPHGKRKRGGSGYGGDGVGDPSPIWDWVLEADVKEGAEKRGAVQAVLRSATKALAQGFPEIPLPTKAALRNSDDGWGFLDLGDFAVHILSKDAKKKWFSVEQPESSLERTYTRWY